MTRALVLNNGLAWAAYQEGALRYLITEQQQHFDVYAGTGFGALNAALAACQEFDALESFWRHASWRKLVSLNWRTPWRQGPLQMKPLRNFIKTYVSERKLQEQGVQLVFNCLDIVSGEERVFSYPGAEYPLVDTLTAALSLPGLVSPMIADETEENQAHQWVDGTFINSFIIQTVMPKVDVCWAIAAAAPELAHDQPVQRYAHWRAILTRSLQLNQAQDVRLGSKFAQQFIAAADAYKQVSELVPALAELHVSDPVKKSQLQNELAAIYQQSDFPYKFPQTPKFYFLTPSQDLDFPLWRFKRKAMEDARALGGRDARVFWQKMVDSE